MGRLWTETDNIAAATRGLIVQRLIVDGWSAAQAAEAFGVSERQVTRWVAAYRRQGMASLRDGDTAEFASTRWVRRLCQIIRQTFGDPSREARRAEPASLVIPPRPGVPPPTAAGPADRHRLWQ